MYIDEILRIKMAEKEENPSMLGHARANWTARQSHKSKHAAKRRAHNKMARAARKRQRRAG